MNRPRFSFLVRASLLSICLLPASAGAAAAQAPDGVPVFELDPSWPAPLADPDAPWPDLDRNATSVAVDPRDHVWMMQLPTPAELEILEPYRGHRFRVLQLIMASGDSPPRRHHRLARNPIERR